MDNSPEPLSILSLCTGLRGIERGIEKTIGRLRPVTYVEIEAFLCENLLAGMEAGLLAAAPIWTNVRTLPWHLYRRKLDFIVAGYPCQPFSQAGLRLGQEDERHLWPYIESGIDTARPLGVYFENVAGHLTLGFDVVCASLRRMGYAVEAGVYTAAEVGAPHKRARLFILGILADAPGFAGELYERWGRQRQAEGDTGGAGQELADPDGDGPGADAGCIGGQGGADEEKAYRQEWDEAQRQRCRDDVGNGGPAMADAAGAQWRQDVARRAGDSPNDVQPDGQEDATRFGKCREGVDQVDAFSQRPPGYPGNYGGAGGWTQSYRPTAPAGIWPARPGEPQFSWEASRTVKSGMGCSINGYNFRHDLLHALGNGVVDWQSQMAFTDLLFKHLKNSQL